MKSEIKSINSVRKGIVATIAKDDVATMEDSALKSFIRDVKIPGFRKGKVPIALIKTRYAQELEGQVNKEIVSKGLNDIVSENHWNVFSIVKFDIQNTLDGKTLNAVIDLKPDFELLDYKSITVDQPEITVTDEEINEAIEQIHHHHADYQEVKRPIQKGDYARLQYTGIFEDGTKVIDSIPEAPIWAEQKSAWEEAGREDVPGIKAIINGIIGMEIDGEKDIQMEFSADFEFEKLQNKKVTYHVKIFEIREKILPEFDDVFFQKINVKDFEDLKAWVMENVKNRKLQILRFDQRESIVQKMLGSATFDIPETALNREQAQIVRNFVERQIREGVSVEAIKAHREKLYADTRELAYDRAKLNFILEKIADKENITVSDRDIEQMIVQEASILNKSPEQLVHEISGNSERIEELQYRARFGKTLDFVLLSSLKSHDDINDQLESAITSEMPVAEDVKAPKNIGS